MTEVFAGVLAEQQVGSQFGLSSRSDGRDADIQMTSIEKSEGVIVRRWDR
jgi:hypothetical protein